MHEITNHRLKSKSLMLILVASALWLGTEFLIGADDAQFISQSVPTRIQSGQRVSVSITMKNTGNTTWNFANHKLGAQNPQDNRIWTSVTRQTLSRLESVAPNQQKIFFFTIKAPSPGVYNFQWRMVNDSGTSSTWFGDNTSNVLILVDPPYICDGIPNPPVDATARIQE